MSARGRESNTICRSVVRALRGQLGTLIVFSLAVNLLLLATSIYMLQVFDRVLSSGSFDTLLWLTVAALFAVGTFGVLEFARRRMLFIAGGWLEAELSPPLMRAGLDARLAGRRSEASLTDVRDVQSFLAGDAIIAFLDAPWIPVFIAVIWLMHPWLGWLALFGAIYLFAVAVANDLITRDMQNEFEGARRKSMRSAQDLWEEAETVHALGMIGTLIGRWREKLRAQQEQGRSASAISHAFLNLTKAARLSLQIMILGLGAWLVLGGELTGGGMIAASIILSRALSPVERAIGAWRSFVSARSAWHNLNKLFEALPDKAASLKLPAPKGALQIERVSYRPGVGKEPLLRAIDLELEAGEACGLIGPSGSGKSTLCRLIVGAWRPSVGHVRLDGADIGDWDSDDLGRHVGYLPQEVHLFAGSIAENIARMQSIDDAEIIEAAKSADVHEMILRLPNGYDTLVGEGGLQLSGGQKQRIALARAMLGRPSLVVLDEPGSNLDGSGEIALQKALRELKRRGTTVIIVAHQASSLRSVDQILCLRDGAVAGFGEREEMLAMVLRKPLPAGTPKKAGGGREPVAKTIGGGHG